jgi:precorrin-2/cobalt-factor-2 C20-methyltransferase
MEGWKIMAGIFYGVGVGPGDPELMTLKAIRTIGECEVLALPVSGESEIRALEIARESVENLDEKRRLDLSMPMSRDPAILAQSRRLAADLIGEELDAGNSVAFLTLGDPGVYSTFAYVYDIVRSRGYETAIVPGVPSFCAAAAALGVSLAEAGDPLVIIPASYDGFEEMMAIPGVKALMKTGRSAGKVKAYLDEQGISGQAIAAVNCGMPGERLLRDINELDESYFSIIIVKS